MRPLVGHPSRHSVALLSCGAVIAMLWMTAALPSVGLGASNTDPQAVAHVAVVAPDVWFTVTPTSEYGKVSSYCTTPCLTVTYMTQYHYGPTCGFPVNFYWDKTNPAGGAQVNGLTCTTPKMKQFQIDGVTYGTHQICAIPYPTSKSDPVVIKCVTFHVLKPAPKPTPTPKPTAAPTPTASPSPSPTPSEIVISTATAVALIAATPSSDPPPSSTDVASSTVALAGSATDFTPVWIGGAVLLGLVVGIAIVATRRARTKGS